MGSLKRKTIKRTAMQYLDFDGTPLRELIEELEKLEVEYGDEAYIDYSYDCEMSYDMHLIYFSPESDVELKARQKLHDLKIASDRKHAETKEMLERQKLAELKLKYE